MIISTFLMFVQVIIFVLTQFYYNFYLENELNIQYNNYIDFKMTRNAITWTVVFIDIGSILLILVAIYILPHSQVKRSNWYNMNKLMISDLTVHLRNMDLKGERIYDEISEVIKHVETVLLKEDKDHSIKNRDQIIYDINFPIMTVYQLDTIQEINDLELEKMELENQNDKEGKIEAKIEKINEKIAEKRKDLNLSFKDDLDDTDDVFITFHNQDVAGELKELYLNIGGVARRCYKCCGKDNYEHL